MEDSEKKKKAITIEITFLIFSETIQKYFNLC